MNPPPAAFYDLDPSRLPAAPSTLLAISKAAADPEIAVGRLSRLVSQDPGLTLELLQSANRQVRRPGSVTTPSQAIGRLGIRQVRLRAMFRVVHQASKGLSVGDLDMDRHWEDSLRRGLVARTLARNLRLGDPEEAFTMGLLQELGTLVLAAQDPELGVELEQVARMPSRSRQRLERDLFGTAHPQVVGLVGGTWGLPASILTPIRRHHDEDLRDLKTHEANLARLLAAADAVSDLLITPNDERAVHSVRKSLAQLPSQEALEISPLLEEVQSAMPTMAKEVGIPIGKQPSAEEVLHSATNSLMQMARGYEKLVGQLERTLWEREELAQLLERKNRELEALAATDPLTGAVNRRRLDQVAAELLTRPDPALPMSVLAFDLDHFKSINDTYGHPVGDEVLCEVVRRLSLGVRPDDVVARLGGEEFLVLLPGVGPEKGRAAAERCRSLIASLPIPTESGELPVTTSVGGATMQGLEDLERLLKRADQALYDSKEGGRNRVTWAA